MRKRLGAAILGAILSAAPAGAGEYTRFEPLPYALAARAERPDGCNRLALMNIPASWQGGDAAVLLLTVAALHDPLRDSLVATLLQTGAAVIEAVTGAGARCGGGDTEDAEAEASPAEALDVLFSVLEAARLAGAGLAVAIGYGPGGSAALEAVQDAVAARHHAAGPAGFAAAAALGAGRPAFALGGPMPASEAAPQRLLLLCEALDAVMDGLGEPARSGAERGGEDCRAALAKGAPAAMRRTADLDR